MGWWPGDCSLSLISWQPFYYVIELFIGGFGGGSRRLTWCVFLVVKAHLILRVPLALFCGNKCTGPRLECTVCPPIWCNDNTQALVMKCYEVYDMIYMSINWQSIQLPGSIFEREDFLAAQSDYFVDGWLRLGGNDIGVYWCIIVSICHKGHTRWVHESPSKLPSGWRV